MLTKQETVLGRGAGGEQEGQGAQENCSATWLTILGFTVVRSGLSVASHSDSGSFQVVRALLSQDGFR